MPEILVSRSVRVNTGNYEGSEYFINCKLTEDEVEAHMSGDDVDLVDVMRRIGETVEDAMVDQLQRGYARSRPTPPTKEQIAKRHNLGLAKTD